MYIIENLDASQVAREWFLREVFSSKTQVHFGGGAYNTKMTPRDLLKAHRSYTMRASQDADQVKAFVVSVPFRGQKIILFAQKTNTSSYMNVCFSAPDPGTRAAYQRWLDRTIPVRKPKKEKDEEVIVHFLYSQEGEPRIRARELAAPRWKDISRNYSKTVAQDLRDLTTVKLDSLQGRFGILRGPAGTGKTHYLRALMQGWRTQANFIYVVDPEVLFNNAGYMMKVLFDATQDNIYNVIICEDAEEFIAPDAKADVGQALARLLNLGDGMLGQGLEMLMLFTTNKPMERLHEAMVRPGRCFRNLEIPRLTAAEATDWLGAPVSEDATLAELYAMREKGSEND